MKRVLIFDSGVGGLSVLDAVVAAKLPVALDYLADTAWLPYGEKSDVALRERVPALLKAACAALAPDLVIIACNTASTLALAETRAALTVPVVGAVPPIKPAAEATRTGVIGLLATPATIARAYTDDLVARFAPEARVIRVGATFLVSAAEEKLAGRPPDRERIAAAIAPLFAEETDVVALACTHFPLLLEELKDAAPRPMRWFDSGEAIARRVAQLLTLQPGAGPRCERACTTGSSRRRAFAARGFAALARIDAAGGLAAVTET